MRGIVIDLFRNHRSDDGYVVHHLRGPREEVANVLAAFPILLELCQMPLNLKRLALKLGNRLALGERLGHGFPVHFIQLRLVVERL